VIGVRELGRRVEVYSARRLGVPEGQPVRGYARCLDCPWWIGTLDVPSAQRAAADHERCGCPSG
jgi:hypothetical protein